MIHAMIDHTLLKADATAAQIDALCAEAAEHGFASVCIQPCRIAQAAERLKGTSVKVCTVIGFPMGANTAAVKAFEAKMAVEAGAQELDMVINIGALKDGDEAAVRSEIEQVVAASGGQLVKVIIECCLLTDAEKRSAARLVKEAGAQFVKTSTGLSTGGATVQDVALLREVVGPDFGVKAAGGIRDLETAMAMVTAGANRIGTSNGPAIAKASR